MGYLSISIHTPYHTFSIKTKGFGEACVNAEHGVPSLSKANNGEQQMSNTQRPLGNPVELSDKKVMQMNKMSKSALDRMSRGLEMSYETPEERVGAETEATIQRLITVCLDGVSEILLAQRGSIADDEWKIDMVVCLTSGRKLGFQIKSSKNAAKLHHEKHPKVPVVWLNKTDPNDRERLVVELKKYIGPGVRIKQFVKTALAKLRALKADGQSGMTEPVMESVFDCEEVEALLALGKLKDTGGGKYYSFN